VGLVAAVDALSGALSDLDDLRLDPSILSMLGDAAGLVLLCSDAFIGGSSTVLDEANRTLHDLIAPRDPEPES
jgi:hypothetical protein